MKKSHIFLFLFVLAPGLLFVGCDISALEAPEDEAPVVAAEGGGSNEDIINSDVIAGFHITSISDAGEDDQGVLHRIYMTGNGKFNNKTVQGGGFFNHWDGNSAVPQTILGAGTWKARKLVSFTPLDNPDNPWGYVLAGILEMEILLFPDGGQGQGIPATLKVICNVGAANLMTGFPEGYFLDTPDGLTFEPLLGLTAFMVDPENDN